MGVWETAARERAESACKEILPDGSSAYAFYLDVRDKMRAGVFVQEYVDFVVQRPRGGRMATEMRAYDLTDAYLYSQMHCARMKGEIAMFHIDATDSPSPDAEIDRNRAALSESLKDDFTFAISNGCAADSDGDLRRAEPIWGERSLLRDGEEERLAVCISSLRVPLEIGTTSSARTFGHFSQERGLARWPYGAKRITVAVLCRCCSEVGLFHCKPTEPTF